MQHFVGRHRELAVLDGALARSRSGTAVVVLVEGEPGAGKSSLLSTFSTRLPGPVRWLRGEEGERGLDGAALDRLLRESDGTRRAVTPAGPRSPLRDAGPLIDLLAGVSTPGPAVLVVDDLPWLDRYSADTLLLGLRRLRTDPVLVLLAARARQLDTLGPSWTRFLDRDAQVTRLNLDGLTAAEIERLAAARATPVTTRVALAIRRQTGGNPLHCRLMLDELDPAARAGAAPTPPALIGLNEIVQHRLAAVPASARGLVEAAAILGRRCRLADAAAVAGIRNADAAGREVAAAYLVDLRPGHDGAELWFTHPLVHAAVDATLTDVRRRALHERAGRLPGPTGLHHRAAAATAPDPQLAEELDAEARAVAAEGGTEHAAQLLRQAAALSADPALRRARLLDALEGLVEAGYVAAAEPLLPHVLTDDDPDARTNALVGRLDLLAGRTGQAGRRLERAWEQWQTGPDRQHTAAATIANGAAQLANFLTLSGENARALVWADRGITVGGPHHPFAAAVLAVVRAMRGELPAARDVLHHLPVAGQVPVEYTDALVIRGLINTLREEFTDAIADLTVAWSRVRAGLPSRLTSQVLTFLGDALYRDGQWGDAATYAELAVSLAHDADRVFDYPFVHGYAALIPAATGQVDLALAHADAAWSAATALGMPGGLAVAAAARAVAAGAAGDHAAVGRAAAQMRELGDSAPFETIGLWEWRIAEIETLISTGEYAPAGDALGELARVDPGGAAFATRRTEAARLRAILALSTGDTAAVPAAYAEARRHATRAARWTQDRLARDEQRWQASGKSTPPPGSSPRPSGLRVTPAQAAVARLVLAGRSNREIATELVISVKTVEYHLGQLYLAHGVHSRTALAALLHAARWSG